MQQATFQWRATSGTSFNCIVFAVSREDRGNLDKPQFAGIRWPGSTRVVVLGQGGGDHVLAIRICVRHPAIKLAIFTRLRWRGSILRKHSREAITQNQNESSFQNLPAYPFDTFEPSRCV